MRVNLYICMAALALAFQGEAAPPAPIAIQSASKTENAAPLHLEEALAKTINAFFEALARKDVTGAYEQLAKGSVIAEKPEEMGQLKSKTKQALELFGEIQGREVVEVKNVGTRLAGVTCLSIGKKFPLRWRFYFYRAEQEWKLIDIRVDDRLVEMFGEPLKP